MYKGEMMLRERIKTSGERGQALIVVIFILLVVALIILAVSARSITDVRISETSEDSARAFSAAEAGVEEAVQKISAFEGGGPVPAGGTISLPNNPNAGTYTIAEQTGGKAFLSPDALTADLQTFQVYLANWNDLTTGNYRGNFICLMWGNVGASGPAPAIEASVIYRDTSVPPVTRVARFPIDPDSARRASNNFIAPSDDLVGGVCPDNTSAADSSLGISRLFAYTHKLNIRDIDLPGIGSCDVAQPRHCVQLLRLRFLYNTTAQYVGVRRHGGPPNDLPLQGHLIESAGLAGQAARRVRVYRSFRALPAIFDFALYNGSTNPLTK